jgi:hypothetical protein
MVCDEETIRRREAHCQARPVLHHGLPRAADRRVGVHATHAFADRRAEFDHPNLKHHEKTQNQ